MLGVEGGRREQRFPRMWRLKFECGQPRWLLWICSHRFDIRGFLSLGFPVDSLGAAVALVSGISGLAVFLVAIIFGRLGTTVTGWGEGFGNFLVFWVMIALTTSPFGQRDFTPLPGPSAWQSDRTAELSEQEFGLWRHSFGHARASSCKSRLLFLSLYTAKVVRRVVSPATTALKMFPLGRESTGYYAACVKSAGSEIRKQQISVSYRTFHTSWPRATDTMNFGMGGKSFTGSWSQRLHRRCVNLRNRMFRDSSSSRTTLSCLTLLRIFNRSRKRWPSGPVKLWKITPSFPSRELIALNQALTS